MGWSRVRIFFNFKILIVILVNPDTDFLIQEILHVLELPIPNNVIPKFNFLSKAFHPLSHGLNNCVAEYANRYDVSLL